MKMLYQGLLPGLLTVWFSGVVAAPIAELVPQARFAACFAPGTSPEYIAGLNRRAVVQGIMTSLNARVQSLIDERITEGQEVPPQFQAVDRWTSTSTDGVVARGTPITLTWSILPDGVTIPNGGVGGEAEAPSDLRRFLNCIYDSQAHSCASPPDRSAVWLPVFQSIFDRWQELTGITYQYVTYDDSAAFPSSGGSLGVRADVRIGGHALDGNSGVLAYNWYPNTGDMVIDTTDNFYTNLTSDSLRLRNVLAHEHGHGMGLAHTCPITQTKLMEPFLTTVFDGPQHDDILSANRNYGDVNEANDSLPGTSIGAVASFSQTNLSIDGTNLGASEVDVFNIDVGGSASMNVTVTPVGQTYLEGVQNGDGSCSAGTSFNSAVLNNLRVEIVSSDQSTVLASASAAAAGVAETLSNVALSNGAGKYYIRVAGDDAIDNVQLYTIDVSVSGAPLISVSPTGGLTTSEAGGSATFDVVLTAPPILAVSIALSSSDTSEGTVSPATLNFSTGNWNVPQTVTVTGVNDNIDDGDIAYSIITAPAVSSDGSFNNLNAPDVAVSNTDDDTAGITVNPTSGLTTSESGGTDTFSVKLNSEPELNVVIGLSSSDSSEGTVSPASLSFSAADWNTPRTVTVTGVDDAILDGDVAYQIVTAAATGGDPAYNGMNAADVSVNNSDNEAGTCTVYASANVPVTIPNNAATSVTSTVSVGDTGNIADLNVINLAGTHTWINDLSFSLKSPAGTSVEIMARSCTDQDDFSLNLDDEAAGAAGGWPCPPIGGGTYKPSNPLSGFDGESRQGTWTLTVADAFSIDGGSLNSWGIEICVVNATDPKDLNADGSVDSLDIGVLMSRWGSNNAAADLNADGTVNSADLLILLAAMP